MSIRAVAACAPVTVNESIPPLCHPKATVANVATRSEVDLTTGGGESTLPRSTHGYLTGANNPTSPPRYDVTVSTVLASLRVELVRIAEREGPPRGAASLSYSPSRWRL